MTTTEYQVACINFNLPSPPDPTLQQALQYLRQTGNLNEEVQGSIIPVVDSDQSLAAYLQVKGWLSDQIAAAGVASVSLNIDGIKPQTINMQLATAVNAAQHLQALVAELKLLLEVLWEITGLQLTALPLWNKLLFRYPK